MFFLKYTHVWIPYGRAKKINSWIYQISRNEIIDYYRARRPQDELSDQLREELREEEDRVVEELSQCMRPMVQRLPHKYREAIEFSDLEGFTQKELSDRLGISLSGAKSRVQRGREKLRQLMLACCDFKFDHSGQIIDYSLQKNSSCSDPCT